MGCVMSASALGQGSISFDSIVARLATLNRITEKPHRMAVEASTLCLAVRAMPSNPHRAKAVDVFCHVYANDDAKPRLLSGANAYPVGSLIVKQKLAHPDDKRATLYTVMRKREPGYHPEHRDWEYAVLDGRGLTLERGRIESCIDCHQAYRATDYVTRTYLDE